MRIFNATYVHNEDGKSVTGIPQRCVLGAWSSLCNDTSIPHNTAELICSEIGYQSINQSLVSELNFSISLGGIATPRSMAPSITSPSNTIYYTNLTCPSYATSIVDCYGDRTVAEACLLGEQEYFVTCFNGNTVMHEY